MLDDNMNAKISDFGLSITSTKQHETGDVFPLKWMSVEGDSYVKEFCHFLIDNK